MDFGALNLLKSWFDFHTKWLSKLSWLCPCQLPYSCWFLFHSVVFFFFFPSFFFFPPTVHHIAKINRLLCFFVLASLVFSFHFSVHFSYSHSCFWILTLPPAECKYTLRQYCWSIKERNKKQSYLGKEAILHLYSKNGVVSTYFHMHSKYSERSVSMLWKMF